MNILRSLLPAVVCFAAATCLFSCGKDDYPGVMYTGFMNVRQMESITEQFTYDRKVRVYVGGDEIFDPEIISRYTADMYLDEIDLPLFANIKISLAGDKAVFYRGLNDPYRKENLLRVFYSGHKPPSLNTDNGSKYYICIAG